MADTTDAEVSSNPLRVVLVATSPPRQCGIATFTSNLAGALQAADATIQLSWAAIDEAESRNRYGPEVRWQIQQMRPESYKAVAQAINESDVDVVSLQHEFGLYGVWGETFEDHLAPFLATLQKPLVTTLHTVLPNPSPSVREAVRRIGTGSHSLVVMAHRASGILEQRYGIDPVRIHVIPHGVPSIARAGRRQMKEHLGLQGRSIITTFGLLDPRKGIEHMVRAMRPIARRHPDALYLILGKTHPELLRQTGEVYRTELTNLVRSFGLEDQVVFIDQYLSEREVIDYLLASDIYVTPYLDPNQITSGTLAYALAAGKAIVSTPYTHAVEALAGDRGLLVDFGDETGLAQAVLDVLDDHQLKRDLEANAYEYGRMMAWPFIAKEVMVVYRAAAMEHEMPAGQWMGSFDSPQRGAAATQEAVASRGDVGHSGKSP